MNEVAYARAVRTDVLFAVVLVACGSDRPPSTVGTSTAPPGPGPTLPSSPTSSDLASCTLASTVVELGAPNDGVPSAPVAVAGGFVVAFTRYDTSGASHLYLQHVSDVGVADEATLLRSNVHASRPFLFLRDGSPYVAAIAADGATSIVPADPTMLASTLAFPGVPEDLTSGRRGVVWSDVDGEGSRRTIHRDGLADVALPTSGGWPEPREETLASGPTLDAVLLRDGDDRLLAILDGNGLVGSATPLFTAPTGTWGEASIAAGAGGFVVVRNGPDPGGLQVLLTDGSTPPVAVAIAPPRERAVPDDSVLRRFPRAAALGAGWVISYWDRVGPSIVRIDASGAITADAIELRSGDERGGYTDARMTTTASAIAVTWQVEAPPHGHGFPEETPTRPGPRLAILRCAP